MKKFYITVLTFGFCVYGYAASQEEGDFINKVSSIKIQGNSVQKNDIDAFLKTLNNTEFFSDDEKKIVLEKLKTMDDESIILYMNGVMGVKSKEDAKLIYEDFKSKPKREKLPEIKKLERNRLDDMNRKLSNSDLKIANQDQLAVANLRREILYKFLGQDIPQFTENDGLSLTLKDIQYPKEVRLGENYSFSEYRFLNAAKESANKLRELFKKIIEEELQKLIEKESINKNDIPKFSIMSSGSLSKGLAIPTSDYEYAFLIDDSGAESMLQTNNKIHDIFNKSKELLEELSKCQDENRKKEIQKELNNLELEDEKLWVCKNPDGSINKGIFFRMLNQRIANRLHNIGEDYETITIQEYPKEKIGEKNNQVPQGNKSYDDKGYDDKDYDDKDYDDKDYDDKDSFSTDIDEQAKELDLLKGIHFDPAGAPSALSYSREKDESGNYKILRKRKRSSDCFYLTADELATFPLFSDNLPTDIRRKARDCLMKKRPNLAIPEMKQYLSDTEMYFKFLLTPKLIYGDEELFNEMNKKIDKNLDQRVGNYTVRDYLAFLSLQPRNFNKFEGAKINRTGFREIINSPLVKRKDWDEDTHSYVKKKRATLEDLALSSVLDLNEQEKKERDEKFLNPKVACRQCTKSIAKNYKQAFFRQIEQFIIFMGIYHGIRDKPLDEVIDELEKKNAFTEFMDYQTTKKHKKKDENGMEVEEDWEKIDNKEFAKRLKHAFETSFLLRFRYQFYQMSKQNAKELMCTKKELRWAQGNSVKFIRMHLYPFVKEMQQKCIKKGLISEKNSKKPDPLYYFENQSDDDWPIIRNFF